MITPRSGCALAVFTLLAIGIAFTWFALNAFLMEATRTVERPCHNRFGTVVECPGIELKRTAP